MRRLLLVVPLASACLGPDGVFDRSGSGAGGTHDTTASSTTTTTSSSTASSSSSSGSGLPAFTALASRRYAAPDEQFGKALSMGGSTLYVTGELAGSVDFTGMPTSSAGNTDVLLFATDADLVGLWAAALGDDAAQSGRALAFSPATTSLFVGGAFSGRLPTFDGGFVSSDEDGFIGRLDAQGAHEGHRFFEDATIVTSAHRNDGWLIGGDFDNYLEAAGNARPKRDGYVMWLNPSLGTVEGVAIGSDEADATTAVASGPSGQSAAVGVIRAPGSVRDAPLEHQGMADAFVVLFDQEQEITYAGSFGDPMVQFASDVTYDAAGNAIVIGSFQGAMTVGNVTLTSLGGLDVFVAVFASDGTVVAANSFGGVKDQVATAVVVGSAGEIIIAGTYLGAPDLGGQPLPEHAKSDVFVLRLDPALNHLASAGFGDDQTQRAVDLAVDAGDHVYLLADVQGEIDFGDGPLPSVDTSFDIALVKFAP